MTPQLDQARSNTKNCRDRPRAHYRSRCFVGARAQSPHQPRLVTPNLTICYDVRFFHFAILYGLRFFCFGTSDERSHAPRPWHIQWSSLLRRASCCFFGQRPARWLPVVSPFRVLVLHHCALSSVAVKRCQQLWAVPCLKSSSSTCFNFCLCARRLAFFSGKLARGAVHVLCRLVL